MNNLQHHFPIVMAKINIRLRNTYNRPFSLIYYIGYAYYKLIILSLEID